MCKKLVLLTRSYKDSVGMEKELVSSGFDFAICPMVSFASCSYKKITSEFDAIIITSKHVFTFIINDNMKSYFKTLVIVVGNATKKVAEKAGFINVVSIDGSAHDLILYIKQQFSFSSRFLYIRGDIVSLNMNCALLGLGFYLSELVVYNTIYKNSFSNEEVALLFSKKIDYILFFSSVVAERFKQLVSQENLSETLKLVIACCISEKVSKECDINLWKNIIFSNRPTVDSVIKKISENVI